MLKKIVLRRYRGRQIHWQVGNTSTARWTEQATRCETGANALISSRVQSIQAQMTHRAMELLALPEDESAFLLDLGCGSGLSGEILDEYGHVWVGCDIAPSMLGELSLPL